MVKNLVARTHNFLLLSLLLPFVYGCKGGGGDSASAGSLFGNTTSGLIGGGGPGGPGGGDPTPTLNGLTTGLGGGGSELASIHNPEPATILLIGSSMVAMGYFKNKKR